MDTRRHGVHHLSAYRIFCLVVLFILAFLFLFPLYWIVTGAFKTAQEVNSVTPVWWPQQWTMANFQKLMSRQSAPLWEIHLPFSSGLTKDGSSLILSAGPVLPAAVRWLINTVFMSLMAMILTCVTATMAGYALAKKRFAGQTILFALIVAAMALPKQVITIPLIREMSGYTVRIGYPRSQAFSAVGCSGVGETTAAATIGMILEAKKDFRLNCIEDGEVPGKAQAAAEPAPAEAAQAAGTPDAAPQEEPAPESLFAHDPAYQSEVITPRRDRKKEKAPKEPKGPGRFVTWIRQQGKRVSEAAEGAFDNTIGDIFDGMK